MPPELDSVATQDAAHAGNGADLRPDVTSDTAPFYVALDNGRFELQACEECGHVRYPIAPVCPCCGASAHSWRQMSGAGTVHSWVRYHRAFLAVFEPLVPYIVVTVQLEEGPRLYGRLVGATDIGFGERVQVIIERWTDGTNVPAFVTTPVPQ